MADRRRDLDHQWARPHSVVMSAATRPTSHPQHAHRLVLFDIDGTLLWSDGAGRRAIQRALIEIFGETGPEDHRFDGKTDPQIVRELMRDVGHEDMLIDERMDD